MIVFLTYFTINCVVLQLEKKYINFIMTCSHFSLKKTEVRLQTDTFSDIFFFFFQKIIKSIKNLFSNIVPSDISTDILSFFSKNYKEDKEFVFKYCSFLYGKVGGKKTFTYHMTMSNFFFTKLCILSNGNPQNRVKTTNQN